MGSAFRVLVGCNYPKPGRAAGSQEEVRAEEGEVVDLEPEVAAALVEQKAVVAVVEAGPVSPAPETQPELEMSEPTPEPGRKARR